ncbi:MAG TPA: hypothetical protein VFS20_10065 [Longimicrobium sp.]|nr:hypothetical protein [Longimicrobium sp.]
MLQSLHEQQVPPPATLSSNSPGSGACRAGSRRLAGTGRKAGRER